VAEMGSTPRVLCEWRVDHGQVRRSDESLLLWKAVLLLPHTPPSQARPRVHVRAKKARLVCACCFGPLALVALVASVAIIIVASTTLAAIAATVTTLSLTLAIIATGTGRSRGEEELGCCWSRTPRGRRERAGAECEFLQDQVIPDLVESRERRAARDDGSKMIVPLVQPPP
jgi:hypothetical protein